MSKSLLHYLSKVPDPRRKQGLRYPQDKVLALVLIGTFAGRVGYRAISRFCKQHEAYLSEVFALRHGTPSHVSFTSIIEGVDFEEFQKAVNQWTTANYHSGTKPKRSGGRSVVALDGKSIKASVKGGTSKSQNFIAFVNAFCLEQEYLLGALAYENGKTSETEVLRQLIENLGIKGAVFTIDANHDSKKH